MGRVLRPVSGAQRPAVVEVVLAEELAVLDHLRRFLERFLLMLDRGFVDGERLLRLARRLHRRGAVVQHDAGEAVEGELVRIVGDQLQRDLFRVGERLNRRIEVAQRLLRLSEVVERDCQVAAVEDDGASLARQLTLQLDRLAIGIAGRLPIAAVTKDGAKVVLAQRQVAAERQPRRVLSDQLVEQRDRSPAGRFGVVPIVPPIDEAEIVVADGQRMSQVDVFRRGDQQLIQ